MTEAVISIGLAKDWIQKLLGHWSEVRRDRRAEIEEMTNVFGDPDLLAPFYVEPDCQPFNRGGPVRRTARVSLSFR